MKIGLLVVRVNADDTIAAARACEERGLDSIWLAEDLWQRGVMPLAGACAAATERIRIGIGVVNPYSQHPSLIAMNYASLAEISKGRAVLGIGASVERWIEQMGLDYSRPRTATKEAIEITRELLAGEASSYQGRSFTIDRLQLGFAVERDVPLYMGAMGERSVRTCGEIADGWVVSILEPVGYLTAAKAWLREGAARAGRDPDALEIVQYLPFACDPDPGQARAMAKEMIALFIAGEIELYEGQPSVMTSLSEYLETVSREEYVDVLRALSNGVSPTEAITDSLLGELAIAGTAEDCVEQLRRYEQAGVNEAVLVPAGLAAPDAASLVGAHIRPALAG